jgi:hypothetical protein
MIDVCYNYESLTGISVVILNNDVISDFFRVHSPDSSIANAVEDMTETVCALAARLTQISRDGTNDVASFMDAMRDYNLRHLAILATLAESVASISTSSASYRRPHILQAADEIRRDP